VYRESDHIPYPARCSGRTGDSKAACDGPIGSLTFAPYSPDCRPRLAATLKAPFSFPFLVLLAATLFACSRGVETSADREDFLAAEAALERGDLEEFERLASGLEGYPLFPYLLYERLSRDPGSADPIVIANFLSDWEETPLSGRLRRAWLDLLANEGRWKQYQHFYVPGDSIPHRCHYLHSLLLDGRRKEVFDQMQSLWLWGRSLPGACDPLLDAWKQAGFLTPELVWQRIDLAMAAGELRLATYLGGLLPAHERIWVDRWLAIHREPSLILSADTFTEAHPYRTRILAHGIARLAPKEPSQTADLWDRLTDRLGFSASQAEQANAAVGFALTATGDRRGLSYLDRIPAREDNIALQERRLRTALKLGYWDGVADWSAAMPNSRRRSEHWLYWQARAEDARGNTKAARALFEAAAAERSLWGFLAAERTGHPYALNDRPVPADPQRLARIEQSPPAARIRELAALGRERDLEREWQWMIRDMGGEDLMAAAAIAQRRGWTKRAILTLAKSGYWDDLGLRFPLPNLEIVRDQAIATGLDASWIYAVLRQESTFDPKARSPAGARGLTQLMPTTAGEVAQSLGLPRPTLDGLFEPRINLTLGSAYLARMHRRFGGNPVLATAAYNAGPRTVDRWLPEHSVDADRWIATIPWRETSTYVRRVLAYRLIYDQRLGNDIEPLQRIMRPIGKSEKRQ